MAGRPIFFKLARSRFSPDLVKIITNATYRKYDEIYKIPEEIALKQYGPIKSPTTIIPINPGILILFSTYPTTKPINKISIKLTNDDTMYNY